MSWDCSSFDEGASIGGDVVFPKDTQAWEVWSTDVSGSDLGAGVGDLEIGVNGSPGLNADLAHGVFGGIIETVVEQSGLRGVGDQSFSDDVCLTGLGNNYM